MCGNALLSVFCQVSRTPKQNEWELQMKSGISSSTHNNNGKVKGLLAAALSGVALAAVSTASAQDVGWQNWFNCPDELASLNVSMNQLKNARTNGPLGVAHRGVFFKPLPDSTYPAENTILAFQYAQCLGYAAVEVDVKIVDADDPKNRVVMSHDSTPDRTTDIKPSSNWYAMFDGRVQDGVGPSANVLRAGSGKTKNFGAWRWFDLRNALDYVSSTDDKGRVVANRDVSDPESYRLHYVLQRAKNNSVPKLNKLVYVLDIQTADQFYAAQAAVSAADAWDRVVFKMFAAAFPVDCESAQTCDHGSTINPKAKVILQVNTGQVNESNGRWYVKLYNEDKGSIEDYPVYSYPGNNRSLASLFDDLDDNLGSYFLGLGISIEGLSTTTNKDQFLSDLRDDFDYDYDQPTWTPWKWPDLTVTCRNGNDTDPSADCIDFPTTGKFSATTYKVNGTEGRTLYYRVPDSQWQARENFARESNIRIVDVTNSQTGFEPQ